MEDIILEHIAFDLGARQGAHLHARMNESCQGPRWRDEGDGAVNVVCLALQDGELLDGPLACAWLVKLFTIEADDLIGAEHVSVGMQGRDGACLGDGEARGECIGRFIGPSALVDVGIEGFKGDPEASELLLLEARAARQNESGGGCHAWTWQWSEEPRSRRE